MKLINHGFFRVGIVLIISSLFYSTAFCAPPQSAIQACAGLGEGDPCNFTAAGGNAVQGGCQTLEGQTACVPNGGAPDTGNDDAPPTASDDAPSLPDTTLENDAPSDFAYFDVGNGTLYIPETDAGESVNYSLKLVLSGKEPPIFDLDMDSITPVGPSPSPDASFDPGTGELSIPSVRVGTDWLAVGMTLMEGTGAFRFMLTSALPGQDPESQEPGETDAPPHIPHPIVDTNQSVLYDDGGYLLDEQQTGADFFGQDANYLGAAPSYTDNGDGTVTDVNTGLLWEKAHHPNRLSYYSARAVCEALDLGDRSDWRLPTLKELFSLADFKGSQHTGRYFLDNGYFDLAPPDTVPDDDQFSSHTVQMMGQTWSSTIYTGDHWDNPNIEAAFFFNFLDGHIKQAPTGNSENFYRCVSGDEYGVNDFIVNEDGTVTDQNSGLIWQHRDDGIARDWRDSLAYCEGLELAGQADWRLPNIKELQSIVDYSRNNPAIDPSVFTLSDSEGWFWSSTTHGDTTLSAAYICFGKCDSKDGVDTHGAGAQRADPKTGAPSDYPAFGGAQNDDVRIYNYSRCVRGGTALVNFVTTDPDSAGNLPDGDDLPVDAPQEAIDACGGLSESSSCSFPMGPNTISGICGKLQDTLVCRP